MTKRSILGVLLALLAPSAQADIVWTGASGNDIFDEANWDLTGSTVTVVDPNVTIDDDVVIANAALPVEIPDLGGQIRFQIGDGYTLTLDNSTLTAIGNDGVGGIPSTSAGPQVDVINGGHLDIFFITNRTHLDLAPLCFATFGGGATPINGSTVDLTIGTTLTFTDEIVADYTNEHLHKTTVDGAAAVIGGNIQVVTDGGSGCIVTVIPQYPTFCTGGPGKCPCGNDNDGSNGGAGCASSIAGGGATLTASGTNSIVAGDLVLLGGHVDPLRPTLFFQGDNALNGGQGFLFGDGLRCVGAPVIRLQTVWPDATGSAITTIDLAAAGGVTSGDTKRYQLWYGDTQPTPCGMGFNLTNAVEVVWLP